MQDVLNMYFILLKALMIRFRVTVEYIDNQ